MDNPGTAKADKVKDQDTSIADTDKNGKADDFNTSISDVKERKTQA